MFDNPAIYILPIVLIISPLILIIAARQDKKTKNKLRLGYITLLLIILLLGFLNWESFEFAGKSAYKLALEFPQSFLWLFFAICATQIALLIPKKTVADTSATILNFVNTVILFTAVIKISNILERQIVSWANITTIFLVLAGNVISLMLINKGSNLMAKFPWSQEAVDYARKNNIKQTKLQKNLTWVLFTFVIIFIAVMLYLSLAKTKGQTENPLPLNTPAIGQKEINQQEALTMVKELPEVKDYLAEVTNAHVEINSYDKQTGIYLIHVYEIKDGHTATFNWYNVDKITGQVTAEFDINTQ